VRSVADARAALRAAAAARVAVVLRTAPDAIATAGPLFLFAMIAAAARGRNASALADAVIDCGADAALAYAALRCGWRSLRFERASPYWRTVKAAAAANGARLVASLPAALDLTDAADPVAVCRARFARGRARALARRR
jgi:hypothetical protein